VDNFSTVSTKQSNRQARGVARKGQLSTFFLKVQGGTGKDTGEKGKENDR
jgi:hypothetical protein